MAGNMQSIVAADGNLYGFSGDNMYSIDLTNGAATFIRATPGEFESEVVAFSGSAAPEPSTLLMGASALLMIGALRRNPRLR